MPQPLFENFSGGFRIKFLLSGKDAMRVAREKASAGGALSGELNGALTGALKNRVFDLIRESQGIQRKIIVEKLEIPDRTLDRYLAELIAVGKIERRGSKKTGGYWALV